MKFDLSNFKTLEKSHGFGIPKSTTPIVSISKNGFSFNSYLVKQTDVIKNFVQIKLDPVMGKIAFVFSDEEMDNSYSTGIRKKDEQFSGMAHVSASKVIRYLNNETDFINADHFRYKFKPQISEEQHILLVDLTEKPYERKKAN